MYAGVDGNTMTQGNPPKIKWSPRVGAVYSLNTKTVLRGGYGIYWAPYNYPAPSSATNNYGQVGFTQNTLVAAVGARNGSDRFASPTRSRTASLQPAGSSLGALAGVGTTFSYVDQNSTAPRVQQYSRRSPARAGGQPGALDQLYRLARRSPRPRRIGRHAGQHQPARSEVHGARRAA